ncbi:MAG: hypothetical protein A2201_01690 [Alicyclobacillus sp. RIFOXYA1_FULL_53_8]|nr:MAG: hypothetical protein A2201_01690 [Alicyclobacillus sp. RIFOXYA1_FULL_53_8]
MPQYFRTNDRFLAAISQTSLEEAKAIHEACLAFLFAQKTENILEKLRTTVKNRERVTLYMTNRAFR